MLLLTKVHLQITRADAREASVVRRLLQLCLHDYTAHEPFAIGANGLYDYPMLDLYWTEPGRHPFIMRYDDQLAGFALVRERGADEEGEWQFEIAEFFVLRALRRKKVGLAAALNLLNGRQGMWEISYSKGNHSAKQFWATVVACFDPSLRPSDARADRERFLLEIKEALGSALFDIQS